MAFKMRFSGGKTPFMFNGDPTIDPVTGEKPKPKETKFIDTKEGRIAVERQTVIPGQEVERLAQPGTPEYDRWLAAVKADPSIEDKYKDRVITEKRDVNVNLRKTPSVFKPGKFYGLTLSKDIGSEMPMENIQGIFKRAMEKNKGNKDVQDAIKRDFNAYLKEAGYVTTPSSSTTTKIGGWYASN